MTTPALKEYLRGLLEMHLAMADDDHEESDRIRDTLAAARDTLSVKEYECVKMFAGDLYDLDLDLMQKG